MLRENVLIALTILITILALSFVILMTVYLQIHENDSKMRYLDGLTKNEEQERMVNIKIDDAEQVRAHQELIRRAETFWNDMDARERTADADGETNNVYKVPMPVPYEPAPMFQPARARATTTTTQAPTPDKPQEPDELITDNEGEDILARVLSQIQEYEIRKRIQEIEERIRQMTENMDQVRPWYQVGPFRAEDRDGVLFKKDTLQEVAPSPQENK